MNRRDWMKMVAVGMPVAAAYRRHGEAEVANALLIVTDDPHAVIPLAIAAAGMNAAQAVHSLRPIEPSRQDLTIVRGGRVIDPASEPQGPLAELARRLRDNRTPGTFLVSLEARRPPAKQGVVFESGGKVVETIRAGRSYRSITIPGATGDTVFSLQDGVLRVVSSSCRHQLCRRSGGVRSGRIVCAPNRLVASLRGPAPGLHAITG